MFIGQNRENWKCECRNVNVEVKQDDNDITRKMIIQIITTASRNEMKIENVLNYSVRNLDYS